eukprot:4892370-Lingulodinium_polyedra.AAC.1
MADTFPPAASPTPEQQAVLATMEPEAAAVLLQYRVPFAVQTALSADGYATMLDLADRWTSKEACRSHSPKDY